MGSLLELEGLSLPPRRLMLLLLLLLLLSRSCGIVGAKNNESSCSCAMMICEYLTRLCTSPFPDSTFCSLTSANNETRMRTTHTSENASPGKRYIYDGNVVMTADLFVHDDNFSG